MKAATEKETWRRIGGIKERLSKTTIKVNTNEINRGRKQKVERASKQQVTNR